MHDLLTAAGAPGQVTGRPCESLFTDTSGLETKFGLQADSPDAKQWTHVGSAEIR